MELDIRKIRKAAGLNQIEFASLFGVHYQTLRRWERGTKFPTLPQKFMLQRIEKKIRRFQGAHDYLIQHGVMQFLAEVT